MTERNEVVLLYGISKVSEPWLRRRAISTKLCLGVPSRRFRGLSNGTEVGASKGGTNGRRLRISQKNEGVTTSKIDVVAKVGEPIGLSSTGKAADSKGTSTNGRRVNSVKGSLVRRYTVADKVPQKRRVIFS